MTDKSLKLLAEKIDYSISNNEFVKLIISNKRNKNSDLKNIIITIIDIKKGSRLNFVSRFNSKDVTKNYNLKEGLDIITENLKLNFFNADLFTIRENIQYFSNKKGNSKIRTTEPTFKELPSKFHNHIKKEIISPVNNVYLQELGVTTNSGMVKKDKTDKFRQINRYIELLAPELKKVNLSKNFTVVDMGSGKGYLTFALYDYLINTLNLKPKIFGIEFRENLVSICNQIAKKSKFTELNFIQGTIEKSGIDKIDVLIALHACDTATDEAIFKGINADAALIVVAPCCHNQIRTQLNVTNEMNSIIKHGILKERQAEILTDGLRALIMEAYGYKTKVFEFISTAHTPKNLMIIGVKQKTKIKKDEILERIISIKRMFGIESHYLESLLNGEKDQIRFV